MSASDQSHEIEKPLRINQKRLTSQDDKGMGVWDGEAERYAGSERAINTHNGDPDVDTPVRQEPVQERPLRRHHVRVLLRLLRLPLVFAQRRTGVGARRSWFARWVRRRVKAGRFLQHTLFRRCCGCRCCLRAAGAARGRGMPGDDGVG